MKQRNPIAVALLPFVTFGIYGLVWQVKTKDEMNQLGADIPTAWLIIVPIVNLYWLWKYSEGVEKVTNGTVSAILAFVLQFLLGSIGEAILQNEFNKPVAAAVGRAPGSAQISSPAGFTPSVVSMPATVGQPQPDASFGGPVTPVSAQAFPPSPAAAVAAPEPSPAPTAPATPSDAQPTQQS